MDLADSSLDSLGDEGFIAIANELLEKCNLPEKISRLEECSDRFFVAVYKGLLGDDLPGLIENSISVDQCALNCQTIIDLVASDILNVDLSHISGKGIVQGDKGSIRNLLEIFAGLLEYFMECIDDEASGDEHDSNLLTSEHDVVSGVLREEFGPSYPMFNEPTSGMNRERNVRYEAVGPCKRRGENHISSLTRTEPADTVITNSGNSTGFDGDTSKLSDSRVGSVNDSTAELIRMVGISKDKTSSKNSKRGDTTDHLGDSLSGLSLPSALLQQSHTNCDCDTGARVSLEQCGSQIIAEDVPMKPEPLQHCDITSQEDELTQYTLTPTKSENSSVANKKGIPDKPSSSFLSGSSTSAAWPEQISPLEPSKDSFSREPGEFDALGVRPKVVATTAVTESNNNGRTTPVYHHYHHHFHHMQQQGGAPDFQSAAEVSAGASDDVAAGQSRILSGSQPVATVSKTPRSQKNRLVQTVPTVSTHPHMPAIPGSSAVSSTGISQPTPSGATGTTSTLTDSVFLSSSASRPPFLRPAAGTIASSGAFLAMRSINNEMEKPGANISATGPSLPASSSLPLRSYRSTVETRSSFDERASVIERANILTERLDSLKAKKSLASTFPVRSSDRLLQNRISNVDRWTRQEEDEGDSESDAEAEDLAQSSDSAIDYGRSAAAPKMKADTSTLPQTRYPSKSSKTPRRTYEAESSDEDSSPERLPRRGVTFRDTVETFPASGGRMERLRHLLNQEADEQRKRHTKDMRKTFQQQFKEIQQEQERERASQQKRKVPMSPGVPKKKPKKKSPVKKTGRLQAVYCSQVRKYRSTNKTQNTVKARKRSASASPVRNKRSTEKSDHPDLLLPTMLEEFPFLHVSPQTAQSMWRQARHLHTVLKSGADGKMTKTQRMIEESERRQNALLGILKKDLDHNLRMREKQELQQQQQTVRAKLREKRQVSARARRYYDEYELRMRARMLKRQTREEQIFKKLFHDGLEIQKQRIRELREYAREKREALAQRQQNDIESLENFYRDQFAMLAEGIAREKFEMEVREKAQEKVVRQMRRELRCKLEREVKEFQDNLQRDEDSAYFRQLEADRLRGKFQLASQSALY
ncbi:centrosomal protein of 95 kDa-like [Acropora muricata]|uniref:centrosomal protein of 95 kDa-like n=1 Tax=Acropora muricata TaxID=159855 RepID=UPI0034E501E2